MFVPIAVMIPRYIIIARTGLVDSFLVHILPNLAMPVGLFLVKQFIDQIPDSLIEAANSTAPTTGSYTARSYCALTKPAIATIAMLSFQTAWSSVEASISIYKPGEPEELRLLYVDAHQFHQRHSRPGLRRPVS